MFKRYKQLISIRINEAAFNPFSKFEFLDFGKDIFAVRQYAEDENESILALHNFADHEVEVDLRQVTSETLIDIIAHNIGIKNKVTIQPYDILWLKKQKKDEKSSKQKQ